MSIIVHIFADTPHHYKPMRQFFTEQCLVEHKQQFWVKEDENNPTVISNPENTEFIPYRNNDELFKQLMLLPKSAQVVFHGLFDMHIWRKLVLLSLVKRCSCIIWGGELYRHSKPNRTVKQRIIHWLHIALIHRLARVYALNSGDAALAGKILKRKNVEVLPYPLIGLTLPENNEKVDDAASSSTIKILVGNSAAASNEHIDAFKQISHLKYDDIEVIVPLNYAGEAAYVNQVIAEGRAIFGDKFTPITKMLAKSAYDDLLVSVDFTVFAQQRQQGLYVVYAMLLMGKAIFLRPKTSSYSNLLSMGFAVKSLDNLSAYSFTALTDLVKQANISDQNLMQQHFTEQALAPKWSLMLNDLAQPSFNS
jgi:dTDP-N-acetylfucosamine:lipid II N-acetylfucosaminyltransferase